MNHPEGHDSNFLSTPPSGATMTLVKPRDVNTHTSAFMHMQK